MQSRESKVVSSKALDASLVVTECSGTKSYKHDTSSSSRTYITHVVDADIRPVKDKEPMAKDASNEAKVKQEIDVLETIKHELESSVAKLLAENEKLNKENEHLKQTYKELYDSIKKTRIQTKDHNDSLIAQVQYTLWTRNINKPVDPKSHTQKPGRQIAKGQRFSPKKSSAVRMRKPTLLDLVLGPAPQRKERCTLQCTLSLEEEKSSYLRAVLSTTSISSHARSVNKWINYFNPPPHAVSLDPVDVTAQELLIQSFHLRQLPLIKMYHLLVFHQQIRKFNLKSLFKIFGLYTSSLLNATCKKAVNLLKKGLLIRGEVVEASNEDEACLTIKFNNFPKVQVKDLEVHDVSNDEENKAENTKLKQ
ncbi:hypothetical protein Tco_0738979 [Tanacetum coccineum]